MGFAEALVMAGWVEPAELPDYLAAADVAMYPFADTLVNRAKCPAKLTELIRAGVPVVADRVGQIPEYFAPELSHLLCAPEKQGAMAETCVDLLRDATKRKAASLAGRAFILGHHAWRIHARRLHDYYLTAASAGCGRHEVLHD
jgi:glycosyltransferase involved in cell wall biosynthesis